MLNELNFNTSPYEISPQTMAIIALQNEKNTITSHVMEEHTDYVVHKTPTEMIEYACRYYGSSFQGRLAGSRDISGFNYKAPITINPASGMYFFPTNSPAHRECSWLSHSHIKKIDLAENDQSEVCFTNGKSIIINASLGSLINQLHRTAQFRFLLTERLHKGLAAYESNKHGYLF